MTTTTEKLTNKQPSDFGSRSIDVDYVIEIEAVNGPCYLSEDVPGDPGRKLEVGLADRFATQNEAFENLNAVRGRYPTRRYTIKRIPVTAPPRPDAD